MATMAQRTDWYSRAAATDSVGSPLRRAIAFSAANSTKWIASATAIVTPAVITAWLTRPDQCVTSCQVGS